MRRERERERGGITEERMIDIFCQNNVCVRREYIFCFCHIFFWGEYIHGGDRRKDKGKRRGAQGVAARRTASA